MDWLNEVRIRLKKRNQVLFTKDTEYLQDLAMLFREQDHRVMVLWALELAAESVRSWKKNTRMRLGPGRRWKPHGRGQKGKSRCGWPSERS